MLIYRIYQYYWIFCCANIFLATFVENKNHFRFPKEFLNWIFSFADLFLRKFVFNQKVRKVKKNTKISDWCCHQHSSSFKSLNKFPQVTINYELFLCRFFFYQHFGKTEEFIWIFLMAAETFYTTISKELIELCL